MKKRIKQRTDLVGDEDDGDLLRGAHLGDQVPVFHRFVETVPGVRTS